MSILDRFRPDIRERFERLSGYSAGLLELWINARHSMLYHDKPMTPAEDIVKIWGSKKMTTRRKLIMKEIKRIIKKYGLRGATLVAINWNELDVEMFTSGYEGDSIPRKYHHHIDQLFGALIEGK